MVRILILTLPCMYCYTTTITSRSMWCTAFVENAIKCLCMDGHHYWLEPWIFPIKLSLQLVKQEYIHMYSLSLDGCWFTFFLHSCLALSLPGGIIRTITWWSYCKFAQAWWYVHTYGYNTLPIESGSSIDDLIHWSRRAKMHARHRPIDA